MRNPFGVRDVPDPDDRAVSEFAAAVDLAGADDDDNAKTWATPNERGDHDTIEGVWASRWNGGADPTIAGDADHKWKQGRADVEITPDRVYVLFDWDGGARKGLLDAARDGATRLVGKYMNLADPSITSPWIGSIVSNERIDGRWLNGRLDFRR
jgi:hypothetical protein